MNLRLPSLFLVGVVALSTSGCIIIPAHRHYAPPRTVVIESDRHPHHGHRHGHSRRYYDDQGPYRR